MKTSAHFLTAGMLLVAAGTASATVRYVDLNSPNPAPPYTNWASAARVIQVAVDASVAGDEIVVTNGIYASGGRAVNGTMTNRVAVDKPLTLRSLNGPEVTVIRGYPVPGVTNGDAAIRCVYLIGGAALMGFTLTNGATRAVNDSPPHDESGGGGVRCESISAVVSNCTLTGNSAVYGGGAYQGTLKNCTLAGNSAIQGGGAYGGTLNNCIVTRNSAQYGGGVLAYQATLNNCALIGNSAINGGGAYGGTLNNCTVTFNMASQGGGVYGDLGVLPCTLNNCIVYFNTAGQSGDNYSTGDFIYTFSYSCTTPLPSGGVGNISADPQLADVMHLFAGSPCRGAGSVAYTTGVDIDGDAWTNPPSMGCDEFYAGGVTGPLSVDIVASYTNVAPGFEVTFTSRVIGHASVGRWDFGDGTVLSNRLSTAHAWAEPGDYPVVMSLYNETHPEGVSATVIVHVLDQVYHVAAGSINPVAPYSSWATAARSIQDAVDAAAPGALVLVTNGVYQTGGRPVYGKMTNRVAVTKPLTVRSVNGPDVTIIQGFRVPGTTNGDRAIRCVYLTNGAALAGFTLTNGATRAAGDVDRERSGGGVWCAAVSAVVSNCIFTGNSAWQAGGGATGGTLKNCTLTGNSARTYGGGASSSTLKNCTLTGNSATSGGGGAGGGAYDSTLDTCTLAGNSASYGGGGVSYCTLNNCTLTANSARNYGGGAYSGTLNNCTVTGNSVTSALGGAGGGAYDSTLNNCTLTGNSAQHGHGGGAYSGTLNGCSLTRNTAEYGGGAAAGTLNNCSLAGNSAQQAGGGAFSATLNNCTLTGNSAEAAGGVDLGTLRNSIVYFNVSRLGSDNNYRQCSFDYSCTTPLPADGTGNIGDHPQLANDSHLFSGSPCRGAGSAAYAEGVDIDGESWASPPSIGCDEFIPGGITGPLTVDILVGCTSPPIGSGVDFTAQAQGRLTALVWDFGDGTVASNRFDVAHGWTVAGDYTVVVTAFNDIYPAGVSATLIVQAGGPAVYVAIDSPNPVHPYNSWATAATNIQDAIDSFDSLCGAGTIIVSNGIYNPAAVTQPITIRSLNGPEVTIINGGGAARCVYLGSSEAALSGFTLTNGVADNGGGVWCADRNTTVSDCVIVDSRALFFGGGSSGGTLNNCIVAGNSAESSGGGVFASGLNNCTVIGNVANDSGGGGSFATMNNCIVYYNVGGLGEDNYDSFSELNGSCTIPIPSSGRGNFDQRPLLLDLAGGNFRLRSTSPCINAGLNGYTPAGLDLDGHARIVGGTVDVGAYEFQTPASLLSYVWLQQYGLPTDGSADYTDEDGDQLNNWQEWRAGTDPTDSQSALRLLTLVPGPFGLAVSWQSVSGRIYFLERSTNLGAPTLFTTLAANIVGQPGTSSYADTNAFGAGPFFYRVGVGN